jgi:hypothetical protein
MPRSTDFLCYWTAGKLLSQGQSPYDPEAQTRLQHDLGWNKDLRGGGRYDFLPFYCPPWLALFTMPFGVVGYPAAERMWFFCNIEFLLVASLLLKTNLPSIPRLAPPIVLFTFFPTLLAVFAGQTTPLILLSITASWCLIDNHRDLAGGLVLAAVTIKPQLAAVVVAGVLLWALRRQRWRVLGGFAVGLGLLCLVSTAILPAWPIQLLRATRVTPLPTDLWPWVGTSWTLALRTIGLHGRTLWLAYAAASAPMIALALGAAWNCARPLREVLALGSIAAFFVSPYTQLYDFPILIIPLLVLLEGGLARWSGTALAATFTILPYINILLIYYFHVHYKNLSQFDKSTMVWLPCLLAVIVLVTWRRQNRGFSGIIPCHCRSTSPGEGS